MNRGDHLATIAEVLAGTTGAKVPYPIGIRELEVVRSEMVGTGLLRLTLGGPELAGFESHAPDEHVRLVYPDADGTLRLPERDGFSLKWPRPLPISREYTVRRYDAEAGSWTSISRSTKVGTPLIGLRRPPSALGCTWQVRPVASWFRGRTTAICWPVTSPPFLPLLVGSR